MIDYRSYKYCLLGNSQWMILYRSKDDYLEIYSEEMDRKDAISMDEFNEIGDYFMNSGFDYINEKELLHAMENNVNYPTPPKEDWVVHQEEMNYDIKRKNLKRKGNKK